VTVPALEQIRPARLDDAEPLGRCHLECWRETYTAMVDGAALAAALGAFDQRVDRWRQILAGPHGTVLAVAGNEVVGFASTGPPRDDDLDPDVTVELYALYVLRARWGTGLGHRLLAATVADAASSLWVLRDNVRARGFYARHGYRPDGREERDELFGGLEIRMVRSGREAGSGA
jgi:GNAT superfamily N-acetyltransferase